MAKVTPSSLKVGDHLVPEKDTMAERLSESPIKKSKVFVAAHAGAGNHSKKSEAHIRCLCKIACQQAVYLMSSENKSAIEAATAALMTLEDDEKTNAGFGSSMTEQGDIECEASMMDGRTLRFGAVAALSGVKNAIQVASLLVTEQDKGPLPYGRIRPSILVGKGAKQFCQEHGIDTNYNHISKAALKTYTRFKRKCQLSSTDESRQKRRKVNVDGSVAAKSEEEELKLCNGHHSIHDTVGVICIDEEGNIVAGSSSGGIWLKHSGRVGSASVYGAGCWAQNQTDHGGEPGVAVLTSGCGEQIIPTLLAKTCAEGIQHCDNSDEALSEVFKAEFLGSKFLTTQPEKMGGVLAVKYTDFPEGRKVEVSWAHSTHSFCIAFIGGDQEYAHGLMSRMEIDKSMLGKAVLVGCHVHYL